MLQTEQQDSFSLAQVQEDIFRCYFYLDTWWQYPLAVINFGDQINRSLACHIFFLPFRSANLRINLIQCHYANFV